MFFVAYVAQWATPPVNIVGDDICDEVECEDKMLDEVAQDSDEALTVPKQLMLVHQTCN